jgi:hypothetical protein
VDKRQRQRVADIICEEWFYSDPSPRYLESNDLLRRLEGESEHVSNEELLDLLDDLAPVYITQSVFIDGRRIEGVDPTLCDETLN